MKNRWKTLLLMALLAALFMGASACDEPTPSTSRQDTTATLRVADDLVALQPTPTNIRASVTRYLLIKRAYDLAGQHADSMAVPCPVPVLQVGQVRIYAGPELVEESAFVGMVVSRETYLTPDSEYYERDQGLPGKRDNEWLPDIDGTYGTNGGGYFWYEPNGQLREVVGESYTAITRMTPDTRLTPTEYLNFTGPTGSKTEADDGF